MANETEEKRAFQHVFETGFRFGWTAARDSKNAGLDVVSTEYRVEASARHLIDKAWESFGRDMMRKAKSIAAGGK